ncbi:MAG: TonB-dependent receptor [Candidatus Aminicenantes bacterium]|nr:TonB-dependent receptor [Candidatus Aminicenantes bacterium]
MEKRALVLALIALAGTAALLAEDRQEKIPPPPRHDVIVTANRVETPEREVASSVTVITSEDLVRTGKTSVADAMREVIGLSLVQNGGPGAAASVSIRGANGEHTLVLLDGLELNDPINPSRSLDLAHLPLSQVDRIEVLRGPQSPLYGSDAMGGVINIITRTGRGAPSVTLASEAGSLGSFAGNLGVQGSGGRADYSFALHHSRTAGVSAASTAYPGNVEKDGYRNLTLAANLGLSVSSGSRLSLGLRATQARTEIDNFGGPGGDDPNSVQDYASFLARLQLRSLTRNGFWERILSASWVGAGRDYLNPTDEAHPLDSEEASYRSGSLKLDWQNNFYLRPSHTLTVGAELEREEGRSAYFSESAWGPSESRFPSTGASTVGLYVLDRLEIRGRLFLSAGLRVDAHSLAGSAVTFRVAPAYLFHSTGTKLRAAVGTGFKSPSLYQLFAPGTSWGPIGNPDLRPERTTGWEAGLEQRLAGERLVLGLTYFRNAFRDLVDFDFTLGYVNVGRARTSGVEISVESRPTRGTIVRAAYTGLRAWDEITGADLLRRPRDKFSAEWGTRLFGSFDLSASVLYAGQRLDRDFSELPYPTVTLPGYALLGLALAAPVGPGFDLFLRLDNLLDARYEPVWGYGAPGFTFRAGFRYAR